MKRVLWLWALLMVCVNMSAQSAYISQSAYNEGDRLADLEGAGGVLVLSKRSDLVITVVNDPSARVSAPTMRPDGYYEYEVVVDRKRTKEPKVEVNRRGDVDRLDWVVITKPDYFFAYLIEETQKPIRYEDQTAGNDAILDASLAQVEFQTTIPDLKVECPELVSRGATITTEQKRGDNSIFITRVTIPLRIFAEAANKSRVAREAHKALYDRLVVDPNGSKTATEQDWNREEQLRREVNIAKEDSAKLMWIKIYADGTNQLSVELEELGPRVKKVYGVLLRTIIEEKHVSQCAGFMAEGGRQFALREYANARQSFLNALNAPDAPANLRNSIQTTIAQCDTCSAYEGWTLRAFARMRDIKAKGGSQEEAVECANSAIAYLQILNRYNPCEFYSSRIKQLEKTVQSLPLEMRFTAVRWVKNVSGFYEAGKISGVEIYAFRGATVPSAKEYKTDKKFRELMEENAGSFVREGVTNENGQADLRLNRQELPKGFFLRPVGYDNKIKIFYIGFDELMRQSSGTYNKRQFRVKMYAEY